MNIKGFTLVEILLTITIISLLTAAVLPSVGNFSDVNILNQSLQNVASDIENAKFKALSGGYAGPANLSSSRVYWGIACANATSYRLSPFQTTAPAYSEMDTSTYSKTQNLVGGTTMSCAPAGAKIVFERLSGKVISGSGTTITITKGTRTGIITISSTGVINVTK